jgi:hypothetical protein
LNRHKEKKVDAIPVYEPRDFCFAGIWNVAGLRLKTYLLSLSGASGVEDSLVKNAHSYAADALPQVRREEGPDHGVGYVILHQGEMATWLLIHWWAHNDIVMRLLASAELGGDRFESQDHRRFHACVWEHVVIDHERNAWVKEAMAAKRVTEDIDGIEGYLLDPLVDGLY